MKDEANLSIMRLRARHCYVCGETFGSKEKKETEHHGISKRLKPKRNVLIPVCDGCHKKINNDPTNIPNFKEFKNFIENIEKFIQKQKIKLGRYRT